MSSSPSHESVHSKRNVAACSIELEGRNESSVKINNAFHSSLMCNIDI